MLVTLSRCLVKHLQYLIDTQLRDNYFGSFTHFVTLEEYRHRHERNIQGDPLELKYRPGAVCTLLLFLEAL